MRLSAKDWWTHNVACKLGCALGRACVREYVRPKGLIYTARQLRGLDGAALQPALAAVCSVWVSNLCYLTLDIDCLDPAFAPGTGT